MCPTYSSGSELTLLNEEISYLYWKVAQRLKAAKSSVLAANEKNNANRFVAFSESVLGVTLQLYSRGYGRDDINFNGNYIN